MARAGDRRRRVILAGVVLLAGVACSQDAGSANGDPTDGDPAPAAAPIADATVDEVQALLDGWTAQGEGGAALAIAHDGSEFTVLVSGVADSDGTPIAPDDGFRIASITKTVVATMVLQLVDEGVLELDDEVSRSVEHPSVPEGVTVGDLLGHTSGISDVGLRDARSQIRREPERRWRPEEVLDAIASGYSTGSGFTYSNTNYILAGLLIESVTGRPFEVELTRRVLEPLGLTGTYLPPLPDRQPIAGFTLLRPHGVTTSTPATASETFAWTAGALVSTAEDLATFFRALTGGELLSPASFAAMTQGFDHGASTGLGLFAAELDGETAIHHSGELDGFRSVAVVTTTGDDLLVLLVNADRDLPPVLEQIDELVFAA
jgi:D-alanyl-D-alanine carboxypeptidase